MSDHSNDSRGRSRRRSPTPVRDAQIILLPREVDATSPRRGWSHLPQLGRRSVVSEKAYSRERQPNVLRRVSPSRASGSPQRAGYLSLPVQTWHQRPRSASSRLPSEPRSNLDRFDNRNSRRIERYQSCNNSSHGNSRSRSRLPLRGVSH